MKHIITAVFAISALFILTSDCYAGAWSTPAIPTHIEIERGGGFMVHGAFGNAANCTQENKFYVKSDHPQYDKLYATVLAAYMAGKKVRPYIHTCEPVTWHSTTAVTYNIMTRSGALYIFD
ncbi:hypothetical protein FM037_24590 [Shewanella psychropiezotolerans]|uniref:Uncharacterized protein n=1 Tax=Shewanella psychropiezotolerans TaxID=2593655 RepID=A0ABX5X3C6_9GAMM|nr:hypothetical protein [Shewanella psychropiezotolerans]QDO85855.1 hypothetical protein FM037_24590 [Shewanella psychropiezotolerans]